MVISGVNRSLSPYMQCDMSSVFCGERDIVAEILPLGTLIMLLNYSFNFAPPGNPDILRLRRLETVMIVSA